MIKNKGGRRRLGAKKRVHEIKIRFNSDELDKVKTILESYNIDLGKRGVVSPFLRRLILNKKTLKANKLPNSFSNLIFQINKIGVNINQITKLVNYKNLRSPSSKLEEEIQKSNALMLEILNVLNENLG